MPRTFTSHVQTKVLADGAEVTKSSSSTMEPVGLDKLPLIKIATLVMSVGTIAAAVADLLPAEQAIVAGTVALIAGQVATVLNTLAAKPAAPPST